MTEYIRQQAKPIPTQQKKAHTHRKKKHMGVGTAKIGEVRSGAQELPARSKGGISVY
jgi:hypothetical protein